MTTFAISQKILCWGPMDRVAESQTVAILHAQDTAEVYLFWGGSLPYTSVKVSSSDGLPETRVVLS
jgi:hypothetical protein